MYGLGEVGMMQGVIYKDFQIIDELPSEARLLGGGLDFGYSVDPAAAVLATMLVALSTASATDSYR